MLTIYLSLLASFNLLFGIYSFRANRNGNVALSGFIHMGLSFGFAFTIGPLLLALGILQVFAGLLNSFTLPVAK
ncbi:hypothetical protein N781_03805 [Pontibacillus halophilus JSM 076056 = DSM 19796]|uniref:Uncharacterized protein n=1 Tax=Pontibacillus halophilus JSM 076056 = DSM 19796 TaxID=1385510 RepID=A0A0A5GKC6_9BACI|nr:hypothetical protein [Pontibacillus halophilus]KGX91683.1 hypothetical protein N781_03805 [Pontibacillus halophilus JSM 076056 = DSM 19796]